MKKLLLFITVSLIFWGCKKPLDGVKIIYNTKKYETTVVVQFIDAKTGKIIGYNNPNERFSLQINGKDKGNITDNLGGTSIRSRSGFLVLAIKNERVPSDQDPVQFSIVTNVNGFLESRQNIEINRIGAQHVVIYLSRRSNLPEGVAYTRNWVVRADDNGTLADYAVSANLSNTSGQAVKASVSIPQGTVFQSATGTTVKGKLRTTLAIYGIEDQAAILSRTNAPAILNGEQFYLNHASYYTLDIDDSTRAEAVTFNNPLIMTTEIPSTFQDQNGVPVYQGMSIPYWSFNETTNIWQKEGDVTVDLNESTGKYEVTFPMTHLSIWTVSTATTTCQNYNIRINSNISNVYSVCAVIRTPTGRFISAKVIDVRNGSNHTIRGLVNNANYIMYFYDGVNIQAMNDPSKLISNYPFTVICGSTVQPISLTLTLPVEISVSINGTCTNRNNQIFRPSASIFYIDMQNDPDTPIYMGEMVDGNITTNLLYQERNYKIGVSVGGDFYVSEDEYTVKPNGALNNTTGVLEPFVWNKVFDNRICNRL